MTRAYFASRKRWCVSVVIASASEAIHSFFTPHMDCFAGARNDGCCLKFESETGGLRRLRHHAVAAVMFCAIERGVGALEQVRDGLALHFQGRQPDRDRDLDALFSLVNRKRLARD